MRVSTDDQASSGLGLEAQRAQIDAAVARGGLELAHVFVDAGVSGSLEPRKRPELARALEELREGDVLLVAKVDRLGRDFLHVALLDCELAARGVRVLSAAGEGTENDDPSSCLMRRILWVFAQYELDMIRDRTRKAAQAKRARGVRLGTVPFGYTVGPEEKLVQDLEEQRALALMRAKRAAGESFGAICRALGLAGCRPRGKRWHPEGVRSILATDRARTS